MVKKLGVDSGHTNSIPDQGGENFLSDDHYGSHMTTADDLWSEQ